MPDIEHHAALISACDFLINEWLFSTRNFHTFITLHEQI